MSTRISRLAGAVAALGLWLPIVAHGGGNVYSVNIVGYVNHLFAAGNNLFANPLDMGTNSLSQIFNPGAAPAGTTVSLWDALTSSYNLTSTYNGSSWSVELTLNPGTGALLNAPAPFINTFVGNVIGLNPDMSVHIPPAFDGPPGSYLLAPIAPIGLGPGEPAFLHVLGRAPRNGESFTWLDELSQTWSTTTYNATTGTWSNGEPTLPVSEAAFFTVRPIPEPGCLTLLLLGAGWLTARRRRR